MGLERLRGSWRLCRRILLALAAVLAVSLFWQLVPLEMAVWFGGEAFLYLEALVSVRVFARVAQVRAAVPVLRARFGRLAHRLRPGRPRERTPSAPERREPNDPEPEPWPELRLLAA